MVGADEDGAVPRAAGPVRYGLPRAAVVAGVVTQVAPVSPVPPWTTTTAAAGRCSQLQALFPREGGVCMVGM